MLADMQKILDRLEKFEKIQADLKTKIDLLATKDYMKMSLKQW